MTAGGHRIRPTRAQIRKRRIVALAVASGLVVASVITVERVSSGPASTASPGAAKAPAQARESSAQGLLGPYGVESRAVMAENRRPGSTSWRLEQHRPPGLIEGFADHVDAEPGDTVGLYVSTTAGTFRVDAYRMGYYGGDGGRRVWSSAVLRGSHQPTCPVTSGINMVSCSNWTRSTSFRVTQAFMPGDYLLKLVGGEGQESYIVLTISDPASRAAYLLLSRSLTEEGWNSYGGFDFYQGSGPCPAGASTYPVCNRARVVSFDRPFTDLSGPDDFLTNEYPLVRFCEQHGLDVTYASDVTATENPGLLLHHKAILSLGHDETWTNAERQGAQAAVARGVNIAFLGAAAVLRHSRLQPSSLGPDREEVDYRDSQEDPLMGRGDPLEVTGNTWSSPPTSRPEGRFVGEVYSGYLEPGSHTRPLVVFDHSAWIFNGTGLQDGSTVSGVIDSDIDHLDPTGSPPGLQVLAHSPVPLRDAYTNEGKWGGDTYSDMTYYSDPSSKAGVFDSGTVNWIYALSSCAPGVECDASTVSQMTGNLLWLFGQGPAGAIIPPRDNWRTVSPRGS